MRFVALLALLLIPTASAGSASILLRDASSVEIDGDLETSFPGGSGRVLGHATTGVFEVRGVTGTIRLQQWEAQNVHFLGGGATTPPEGVRDETFKLANATLRLVANDERLALRIAMAESGRVVVSGRANETGLPRWLEREVTQEAGIQGEDVGWTWSAGWPFLGDYETTTRLVGFPAMSAPLASIEGDGRLQLSGGNLSFIDAEGREHHARLGNWSVGAGDVGLPDAKVRREAVGRAVVDGAFASASLPLREMWGFSAPAMSWRSDGLLRWRDASGSAEHEGARLAFEDATLLLRGAVETEFSPTALAPALGRASYEVAGDVAELRVDGRAVTPASAAAQATVAVGLTVGLLAAAAAWIFYTRIDRKGALEHPMRAKIRAAVDATPGIHLRALHREVGGAWGPFTFHVQLLARMGHVVIQRDGRFRSVLPPGGDARTPLARGTQARVLEAIQRGGAKTTAAQLSAELGLSQRLVRYHLTALRQRGLVTEMPDVPVLAE